MLCIKTKLRKSNISGIGIFADETIEAGMTVWKFEPTIDILLSNEEILNLPEATQRQILNYAYLDKTHGKYLLCGDDGRFFNHSFTPNCDDSIENKTIALRRINIGEELTVDYTKFYGDLDRHPEIFYSI